MPDPAAIAKQLIDANQYLTLATADDTGRPWACPVWYAHQNHTHFVWVSRPGARHSRNITTRATVGGVIFDTTVTPGAGQAVYFEATAEEVDGVELDQAIAVFSRRSVAHGLKEWRTADVTAPKQFRLYRATVSASFILDGHDQRISVRLD